MDIVMTVGAEVGPMTWVMTVVFMTMVVVMGPLPSSTSHLEPIPVINRIGVRRCYRLII